jgi:hypothetical protein
MVDRFGVARHEAHGFLFGREHGSGLGAGPSVELNEPVFGHVRELKHDGSVTVV